eukprot:CAMPEP_0202423346 /NCGR_PEP_ID=MMETSP1128-20130828/51331_1 /ASSEMBLY_ACC=CAM_ASM_000463 /TAXON_ID=3047 /ORGANISM="Dunaliella tertiolecta, Strain CCMP1320" /LENGTH=83 /DNA_ID=CAMNT_0049031445 /DNA_START=476 /DNA_END=727 /DNA_ORIENTATION=-
MTAHLAQDSAQLPHVGILLLLLVVQQGCRAPSICLRQSSSRSMAATRSSSEAAQAAFPIPHRCIACILARAPHQKYVLVLMRA